MRAAYVPKSSASWLWMLKVATGTPKHPPAKQLSHMMLAGGCCLSCSGHSHSTEQHWRERKRREWSRAGLGVHVLPQKGNSNEVPTEQDLPRVLWPENSSSWKK